MVERFPDLHISTRLLPLALAALVAASACKPKPEEEVVGTPPPEDRIAPPERAERYPLSGIEPKANQAWFKKCYKATSLETFQVTPSSPSRDVLFSVTNRPSKKTFTLTAIPKRDVEVEAMQRCLEDALREDGAHLPLDKSWTTGHMLTVTAREDGAENIKVSHYKPVIGAVSEDERKTQLTRIFPDIQRCYGRALRISPEAEGAMVARYGIDNAGTPKNLEVLTTINDPNLKTCLHSVFSKMRFSPVPETEQNAPTLRELIVLTPG